MQKIPMRGKCFHETWFVEKRIGIFWKNTLDKSGKNAIICLVHAGVAHPVERHLAKVEVASSSLVTRSRKETVFVYQTKAFSFHLNKSLAGFVNIFCLNEKVCVFGRSEVKQHHSTWVGFWTFHPPCLHSLGAQDAKLNTLTARLYLVTKCKSHNFFHWTYFLRKWNTLRPVKRAVAREVFFFHFPRRGKISQWPKFIISHFANAWYFTIYSTFVTIQSLVSLR